MRQVRSYLNGLEPPECHLGYPIQQLKDRLPDADFEDLNKWMSGQTGAICEGRRYDHETREYEPDECANEPHGFVWYTHDIERWKRGLPVID